MGKTLAVVTPWYPNENNPFAGSFVRAAVRAVRPHVEAIQVLHSEDWYLPDGRCSAWQVRRAFDAMVGRKHPLVAINLTPRPEAALLRVPALVPRALDYAVHARAHERAVRAVLPRGRIEADVVHGHVGIFGGWVATRLAPPDVPVFVTEHASFLRRIWSQPLARKFYRDVLARCLRFFCVSEHLRMELVEEFPEHQDKVVVLPNPVTIEAIPIRPTPVAKLSKWLYVGEATPQKGTGRLLEAFAACAAQDPAMELTLLGGGRMSDQIAARADALGLAGRVNLVDAVHPEEVPAYLHAHDLLVHLSQSETFGMTVVEAIASGLPVLVTRCGGPEETLRGIEHISGATVAVADGAADVVAAYRALVRRLPELDLEKARAVLLQRFGAAEVGRTLACQYDACAVAPASHTTHG